jgi:hypothetical protein
MYTLNEICKLLNKDVSKDNIYVYNERVEVFDTGETFYSFNNKKHISMVNEETFWDEFKKRDRPMVLKSTKNGLEPLFNFTKNHNIEIKSLSQNTPFVVETICILDVIAPLIAVGAKINLDNKIANARETREQELHDIRMSKEQELHDIRKSKEQVEYWKSRAELATVLNNPRLSSIERKYVEHNVNYMLTRQAKQNIKAGICNPSYSKCV